MSLVLTSGNPSSLFNIKYRPMPAAACANGQGIGYE